ncbi:MAG TPA: SRPBCC domain-containing protein [Acidimicrobiales bacterium]|nr:SRPBCC domain-containing protein [Acidimicrobiales bacterium]
MPVTDVPSAVRLERTIPAPVEQVYRAWLDPELIVRWMNPGTFTVSRVEVDERLGGAYRIWHAEHGVELGGFDCQVTALEPNRRIAFLWGFVGPERRQGPAYDSVLTVTLAPTADGATALTLVHERLDALADAMPEAAGQVRGGWDDVLGKLAALLS